MKIRAANFEQAFALVEALVIGSTLLVLAMLLAALDVSEQKARRVNCLNNLKQIGAATRQWEDDHSDGFPSPAPVAAGGVQEVVSPGNAVLWFQVRSNVLGGPEILYCPSDFQHNRATNFASLTRSNVSYFIALGMAVTDPQSIVSGDDNLLLHDRPVPSGLFNLSTNQVTWSRDRHQGSGNVLLADGSTEGMREIRLADSPAPATNFIAIP